MIGVRRDPDETDEIRPRNVAGAHVGMPGCVYEEPVAVAAITICDSSGEVEAGAAAGTSTR